MIEQILTQEFAPQYLEIIDDSHLHAGHREASKHGGTHFRVTLISDHFSGLSLLKQHKLVHAALDRVLKEEIHALELKTSAPSKSPN